MSKFTPSDVSKLKALSDPIIYKSRVNGSSGGKNIKGGCITCGLGLRQGDGEGVDALKLCTGCKKVRYCSIACQKKDWKRHKEFCKMHNDLRTEQVISELLAVVAGGTDRPSAQIINGMVEDFVQLHRRMITGVVAHEMTRIYGTNLSSMDVRKYGLKVLLELRDPSVSPASIFKYVGGTLPCLFASMSPAAQDRIAFYTDKVHTRNQETYNSEYHIFSVPALFEVDGPIGEKVVYMTSVEIAPRDAPSLTMDIWAESVSEGEPWWKQLDYFAERGICVRQVFDERWDCLVEWMGMLQQKDTETWRWEKTHNVTNRAYKELLREMHGPKSRK